VALGSSGAPADGFASDGAPASRWARERLYGTGGVLFHGPAFQVLDDVRGPTPDWAAARVRSTAEMGWPEESWVTDPAAVDGCLQLAVLWAAEVLGRATLPMQIEAYEQYRRPPVSGPLRCALRRRDVGALTASADVRLFGPDDTPIADLRGIALVARPS
jgi:hypothetical protein